VGGGGVSWGLVGVLEFVIQIEKYSSLNFIQI
jgi:hypothetical protein